MNQIHLVSTKNIDENTLNKMNHIRRTTMKYRLHGPDEQSTIFYKAYLVANRVYKHGLETVYGKERADDMFFAMHHDNAELTQLASFRNDAYMAWRDSMKALEKLPLRVLDGGNCA